jgi:hypothetical protein
VTLTVVVEKAIEQVCMDNLVHWFSGAQRLRDQREDGYDIRDLNHP